MQTNGREGGGVNSPGELYCRDLALVNEIYSIILSVKGTRSHGFRGE